LLLDTQKESDANMFDLRIYPDGFLSKKSTLVTVFDEKLTQLVIDMYQCLETFGGIGLSACQIGIDQSMFVYKVGDDRGVMINPRVIETSDDMDELEEGCLSLPGLGVKVKRPLSVTVQFQNETGEVKTQLFTGLLARCIQHEYDHLIGLTIVDYLSKLKRDIIRKKLQKAVARMIKADEIRKAKANDIVQNISNIRSSGSNLGISLPGGESL
jgi:peptide deformylase